MSVKISKKRMSSTFARGSDTTPALARVLDLFDSDSSASDGKTAPPVLPQKRPRMSSTLKDASKTSATKGDFEFVLY
jgi:hypothetical protein